MLILLFSLIRNLKLSFHVIIKPFAYSLCSVELLPYSDLNSRYGFVFEMKLCYLMKSHFKFLINKSGTALKFLIVYFALIDPTFSPLSVVILNSSVPPGNLNDFTSILLLPIN